MTSKYYFLSLLLAAQTLCGQSADWLVFPQEDQCAFSLDKEGRELLLHNGWLSRKIRLLPNAASVSYRHEGTGEQFIRSCRPEARVTLNGKTYSVGGLYGQKEHGYLVEAWIDQFTAHPADFQYTSHEIEGKTASLLFLHPELPGVQVRVHYQLYPGMPLLKKWVTVENNSREPVLVGQIVHEILAMPEEESAVVGSAAQMKKPARIHVENTFAFNNAMRYDLSDQGSHWKVDSSYTSQVNYNYQTPCVLEVYPDKGIGVRLAPGERLGSIQSYELLLDSYDRERNGLARRRMYRTIAPWTNRNPIFMHLISTDPAQVRSVVDQCVETGYEMVILSFGSGLNMEDTSQANIAKFKALADYAHQRGIKLGGYSLFSSRKIDAENDVIDPASGLPDKHAFFGNAPCLASKWGLAYLEKIAYFIETTGFDLLEHDGPYPGDVCASTSHPGHEGLHDSQWKQMELQKGLYRRLNARGVYINAPDWYFLDGTHKIALGYREVNFSLPREQQKILNRQNIYDGTWEKTPSMSWGFVPLTKYHGGGPESVLEPLSEHIDDYRQLMVQYYGAGVQACYRGPRLYDTEQTLKMVQDVIAWYKQHRDILNSDIIHLRRPDGRDWDGILHVNPGLPEKGMAMLYNPLPTPITRRIKLPLYYTGLSKKATIQMGEEASQKVRLDKDGHALLDIRLPAGGYAAIVVK